MVMNLTHVLNSNTNIQNITDSLNVFNYVTYNYSALFTHYCTSLA